MNLNTPRDSSARVLLYLWLCLISLVAAPAAHANTLIALDADTQPLPQNKVIVLMFTDPQCPFCYRLEQEVLLPLLASGEHDETMVLRSVEAFSSQRHYSLGQDTTVTGVALAQRFGVSVVPTLVFVDASGQELAQPLEGVSNYEYYGYYLSQQLTIAAEALLQTHTN